MFSANTPSSNLPYSAKTSLQALLKSRRELLGIREKLPNKSNEKHLMRNLLNVTEKSFENFESNESPTENNACDVDQNGDFTYSQKLFHIADGNLYSIFSPLQGRSYGMKPSFLRKQKCTVQECRGRGRKVLRKGLKFHNFLPSESVTSEKGSNASVDEQWKVHSECKLKEEHGTKQIMVSNWFHNVKHSSDNNTQETSSQEVFVPSNTTLESTTVSLDIQENKRLNEAGIRTSDFNVPTTSAPMLNNEGFKLSDPSIVKNSPKLLKSEKSDFLNSLLLTVSNSHISHLSSPETNFHKQSVCEGQKHRRKPEQTRRIVPYTKYLSLVEENETRPLDLSVHSNHNVSNSLATVSSEHLDNLQPCDENDGVVCSTAGVYNKAESIILAKSNMRITPKNSHNTDANNAPFTPVMQSCHSNTSRFSYPVCENSSSTSTNENILNSLKQNYFTSSALPQCSESKNAFILNSSILSHQNSCAKYCDTLKLVSHTSRPRKKSQRSVIKQKLEDTFKQNGFLVKTKQVSDGEATFCKFRQLRKYTRYYLKSWQQHLPDEVHKMWKGFLPPKTVLPSISGTTPSSETT